MFITRNFVYVHLPKTGGTFVETALDRVFGHRTLAALSHRIARKAGMRVAVELPKHGTVRDIPSSHQHLPVLANMRNPFDRYVSMYKYSRFRKHPEQFGADNPVLMKRWPTFPDLSFEQYVHYLNDASTFIRFPGFDPDDQPGVQTQQFLYFYTRNIEQCARNLTPDTVESGGVIMMLPEHIHFIHTHNLNRDLYAFLFNTGRPEKQIRFILEMGRILPDGGGRNSGDNWQSYYSPELYNYVERKEKILLDLFPQYRQSDESNPQIFKCAA